MEETTLTHAMVMGMACVDPERFKAHFLEAWVEDGPDVIEENIFSRVQNEEFTASTLVVFMDHMFVAASYVRDHDPDRHREWGDLMNSTQIFKHKCLHASNVVKGGLVD